MRKRYIKYNYLVGGVSIGLLSLIALALCFPSVRQETWAVDCAPGEEPCTTTFAETGVELMVASTVSVALQSSVNLDVVPKSNGAFVESTAQLTVATNNPSGYAVYMQAGKSMDGVASLTSSDLSNTAVISPVEGKVGSSSFPANTWGYSLDGEYYQAVPATTGIIKETTATSYNDTYTLSFGVKVDTNLPAGQYTNSVTVSAVANPIEITSLSQLTYMQDMTSDICTNTAEHVTKRLIDTRDGKSYWVAKLKDGNCWMTQNLALDLSTSKTLTPADTDVSDAWTPKASTNAYPFHGSEIDEEVYNYASWNIGEIDEEVYNYASWNIGETVLATPLAEHDSICEAWSSNLGYNNNQFTVNIANVCKNHGLVDVSDSTWQPTFVSRSGDFDGNSYPLVTVNEADQTYDAHYLLGNYYQFGAATVGSLPSGSAKNIRAPYSICPNGWGLPYSGVTDTNKPLNITKSFYGLLSAYGYPSSDDWNSYITPILDFGLNSKANPLAPPIYAVATGDADIVDGSIWGIGDYVPIWSNTAYRQGGSGQALPSGLTIYDKEIRLSAETYAVGHSVRCVAN